MVFQLLCPLVTIATSLVFLPIIMGDGVTYSSCCSYDYSWPHSVHQIEKITFYLPKDIKSGIWAPSLHSYHSNHSAEMHNVTCQCSIFVYAKFHEYVIHYNCIGMSQVLIGGKIQQKLMTQETSILGYHGNHFPPTVLLYGRWIGSTCHVLIMKYL